MGLIWNGIVLSYTVIIIKEDMEENVTFEQNSKGSEIFMVIKMAVLKRWVVLYYSYFRKIVLALELNILCAEAGSGRNKRSRYIGSI